MNIIQATPSINESWRITSFKSIDRPEQKERIPPNTKTFDFYDAETGVATSAKTLDTTTAAKINNPSQVYYSLKGNIDAAANFTATKLPGSGTQLTYDMINTRELNVAIPANTTPAQWTQINKAIDYAKTKGVVLNITKVK